MLVVVAALVLVVSAPPVVYNATWTSLMTRPLPAWYDDAKVGLFMHWGVFSVPSYGLQSWQPGTKGAIPAEWYWNRLENGDPRTNAFHNATYGASFSYAEFAPAFTATFFNATAWAVMFRAAGLRYVVLTAKHHDGFTNWCSAEAFGWNSCDTGPKRDLVGELAAALRAAGLRVGLYHSLYEWFHPLLLADEASGGNASTGYNTSRYVDEVLWPQQMELHTKFKPDLHWSDGDQVAPSNYWRAPELLAWLYNDGAGTADSIVVNDRWGTDSGPIGSGTHHGGYFSGTDRQQAGPTLLAHKWENAFTLDATSWGYARNDGLAGYLNITTVLYEVVSTVAYGGNALINVGPTADGRIATIFQERLAQLGAWLGVNGDAVYGSAPWRAQNDTAAHGVEQGVYFTAAKPGSPNAGAVYAFAMEWPDDNKLVLTQPKVAAAAGGASARMLGCAAPMHIAPGAPGGVVVTIPYLSPKQLPSMSGPWVFELTNVE